MVNSDIDVQLRACTECAPTFVTHCVSLHHYLNSIVGDLPGQDREDFVRLPRVPEV